MKPTNTLLLFLFFAITTHAQKPSKLDSLKNVLAHLPAEGKSFAGDTLRVRVLCEMGGEEINPKKSHEYLSIAKLIAEKQNDKRGQLLALDKFSQLYEGQSGRAIEYDLKGLAIAESLQDYKKLVKYTNKIRYNYTFLGDNVNALKFAKYNFVLNKKHGNLEEQLLSLNNIGTVYFQMKEFDLALGYFLKIHKLNSHLNSNKIESSYLINSAKIYMLKKNNSRALINLQKALKINDGFNNRISFVANEIALIYLSENRLNDALRFAKVSEIAVKELNVNDQIPVLETLSKIYKKMDNPQKYAKYLEDFTNLSLKEDSVKNARLTEFVNLDYITEKQLLKINDLNINVKEQEYRNKFLILGIITSVAILIGFIFFYRTIRKKSQEISIQNQRIEELNKSLEFKVKERTSELLEANKELIKKNFEISEALFKGQTIERKRVAAELHDNLGSTLSALKWRLGALDSENLNKKERVIYESIKSMMNGAYEDVRNLSHNLLPKELAERGLVGAIQKLADGINGDNKLKVNVIKKGLFLNIDKKKSFELYSVCMEIMTNIMKHSKATTVDFLFVENNSQLNLTVYDNGIGLLGNHTQEGMGLQNLYERIESIGGQLKIDKNEQWSTIINIKVTI
jgi:signal transduction histidine kinase